MYTKKVTNSLFGRTVEFYKDGKFIARKTQRHGYQFIKPSYTVSMTRKQAFRYWEKHFPNRICWGLPEIMERLTGTVNDNAYAIIDWHGQIVVFDAPDIW